MITDTSPLPPRQSSPLTALDIKSCPNLIAIGKQRVGERQFIHALRIETPSDCHTLPQFSVIPHHTTFSSRLRLTRRQPTKLVHLRVVVKFAGVDAPRHDPLSHHGSFPSCRYGFTLTKPGSTLTKPDQAPLVQTNQTWPSASDPDM